MKRKRSYLPLLFALTVPGCSFLTDFDGYTFEDGGTTGDAGMDLGPDDTPPEVTASSPTGTLVDGRTPVVVTFSEPVIADESDITVTLDTAVTITGTVVVSGSTLTFTPDDPFVAQGTYDVGVGVGVTDLSGNALVAPFDFGFEVPITGNGGATSRRLDVDGEGGGVACPHLAMDTHGNAMVLFQRGSSLHTAYYRAGAGWEDTRELAEGNDGVLAMSPEGRIAVAYTGTVAGVLRTIVRTAPGQGDTTFGPASLADEGALHAVDAWGTCSLRTQTKNVAINDSGVVAVVWKVMTPTGGDPIVGWTFNRRDASGTWSGTAFSSNYPFVSWPDMPGIGIDEAGNVEAVYKTFTSDNIHGYRRYDVASGGWLAASTADAVVADYAPRIVMDAEGNFTFGLAIYDFGDSATSVVVRSRDFNGTASVPVQSYPLSAQPSDVWATSINGPWVIWRAGMLMGVSGFFGVNWDTNSTFLSDADATNPIIVGTGGASTNGATAVMVYEHDGEVRTSVVSGGQFGVPAAVPRVLPTGTFPAHNPRVVYDVPGQHGIVTWMTNDPAGVQIYATEFHSLPPSTL